MFGVLEVQYLIMFQKLVALKNIVLINYVKPKDSLRVCEDIIK